jgi:Lipocalin-like domain
MKARLGWTLAVVVALSGLALSLPAREKDRDEALSAREPFVGAWRLAWMEQPGPDGKLTRITDRKGTLMYTPEGRMSVQIQFPESQSSVSNDYVLNGYEASFGRYEVNEEAHTVTRHVEGSVTRGLVGQHLTRAYLFSDGRMTMRSVRRDEHWSVTWERYGPPQP